LLIADLHWLVHQGHVLEFADGKLDTAKKPLPKPPKPEKKSVETKPTTEAGTIATVVEAASEILVSTEAETPAPEPVPLIEPAPAVEPPNQLASEPPVS
jgi:hypothetical protein